MAETADSGKLAAFHTQMAFVAGYTGECGKELVKELLKQKVFKKIILIGRRQVTLEGGVYQEADFEQRVVDFDNLDQHKDAFENCSVGFCCLGTTKAKSGAKGFVKIDHDYVVSVAKMAAEQGCQHFSVVSSVNAKKTSWFLYPKTKGLMEEHVTEIGFPRLSIFRPGFLLCERQEGRFGEVAATHLLKPVIWAKPTWISVPTTTVARALVANLVRPSTNKVEIIENAQIHEIASSFTPSS